MEMCYCCEIIAQLSRYSVRRTNYNLIITAIVEPDCRAEDNYRPVRGEDLI